MTAACHIHGTALKKGRARIQYGFPGYDEYRQAQDTLFPLALTEEIGGCIPMEKVTTGVLFCPECRKAEKLWKQAHGGAS